MSPMTTKAERERETTNKKHHADLYKLGLGWLVLVAIFMMATVWVAEATSYVFLIIAKWLRSHLIIVKGREGGVPLYRNIAACYRAIILFDSIMQLLHKQRL